MSRPFTPLVLLSWAIGLYALILGILQISGWSSESQRFARSVADFFGQSNSPIVIIFAITEIVVGVLMILAPLGFMNQGANQVLLIIAAIFWIVKAVFALFIDVRPFHPEVLPWLKDLARYLILVLSTWEVRRSVA